jgi:predicted nucleic acid-binding protein
LAAVAKAHQIDNLLTLNADDFKRFALNAVHPKAVVV